MCIITFSQSISHPTDVMASQLQWFYDIYYRNDPRTSDWFLVSRPGSVALIVLLYLYFCLSAGPRYMRNREPYSLRMVLIIYNLIQVLLSIYLVYEGLMAGWLFEYSWTCQPVDYSDNPAAIRMARGTHLYFICKIVELLDTVFFVLRKKNSQISFLHLYHHASMPLCGWLAARYFAGGHPTLLGVLNSFVHIIMYSYYMLAAIGPEIQKYLWWKKYLTLLQIVQFLIIGVHNIQMLFTDCDVPKILSFFIVCEAVLFVYLFGDFYVKSQIRKNAKNSSKASGIHARTNPKSD